MPKKKLKSFFDRVSLLIELDAPKPLPPDEIRAREIGVWRKRKYEQENAEALGKQRGLYDEYLLRPLGKLKGLHDSAGKKIFSVSAKTDAQLYSETYSRGIPATEVIVTHLPSRQKLAITFTAEKAVVVEPNGHSANGSLDFGLQRLAANAYHWERKQVSRLAKNESTRKKLSGHKPYKCCGRP